MEDRRLSSAEAMKENKKKKWKIGKNAGRKKIQLREMVEEWRTTFGEKEMKHVEELQQHEVLQPDQLQIPKHVAQCSPDF